MTIAATVLAHAGAAARRPALVVDGRPHTYGRLSAEIAQVAAALVGARVADGPHPRVGILMEPGAGFFAAFLGAGAAGAAAMVLQRTWSDRELAHALAAGGPVLVLATADHADRLADLPRDAPRTSDGRAARLAAPPRRAAVITVDRDTVAPALRRGTGPTAHPPALPPVVDETAPFYVGFTSGTTGTPKGFVRSHRSWLRSFAASAREFAIGPTDHVLAPGPLDHSLFLYAAVHGLSVGATVHLHRRFTARAMLDTLATQPITTVYVIPTMLAALLRSAERRPGRAFPQVRSVICSGARWPDALRERVAGVFPDAEVIDFYGASELSFVSIRRPATSDAPGCVGRPFAGVEVAIRRDDGAPAATGEHGRLWVRSDMVFSGYLEPGTPGAAADADGWATVGDVAWLDAGGRLHLVGRAGGMLVCGGLNVYPEEVEDVLLQVPQVAEVAVTGLDDAYWGDLLCAVVRWRDGRALPRAALREHCRTHLAHGKRPQRWLQVTGFPRTASGKIARAALAAGLRDGTLAAEEVR